LNEQKRIIGRRSFLASSRSNLTFLSSYQSLQLLSTASQMAAAMQAPQTGYDQAFRGKGYQIVKKNPNVKDGTHVSLYGTEQETMRKGIKQYKKPADPPNGDAIRPRHQRVLE
jgi:hypothetical protein